MIWGINWQGYMRVHRKSLKFRTDRIVGSTGSRISLWHWIIWLLSGAVFWEIRFSSLSPTAILYTSTWDKVFQVLKNWFRNQKNSKRNFFRLKYSSTPKSKNYLLSMTSKSGTSLKPNFPISPNQPSTKSDKPSKSCYPNNLQPSKN